MRNLMKSLYTTANMEVQLRKLKIKDAPLMLEWMHMEDIICNFNKKFFSRTLDDCECFIRRSLTDTENLHMAIVDLSDTYLGTVSLKSVDARQKSAEFAIVCRKCAMGRGVSNAAMEEIIRIGMEELHLKRIYWNVLTSNLRAVRFYDKNGYTRICRSEGVHGGQAIERYLWYEVKNCRG